METVIVPGLFSEIPADDLARDLYCDAGIRVLRDAEVNCVLLTDTTNSTDSAGKMWSQMESGLDSWPAQYRKKARERMRKLVTLNRFIPVEPERYRCRDGCAKEGCAHALGIADAAKPDAVIGPPRCDCGTRCDRVENWTALSEYDISPFSYRRRDAEGLEVGVTGLSRVEFEERFWKPLFRHAKHVKIFDRQVGKSFEDQFGERQGRKPVAANTLPPLQLAENYQRGLEWAYSQFLAHSQPNRPRTFEVYCALSANLWSEDRLRSVASSLQGFGNQMTTKFAETNVPFKIVLKRESGRTTVPRGERRERGEGAMRHARYLFTDQMKLLVERGFDLLDKSREMVRDVTIKPVANPGQVQAEIDNLEAIVADPK